MITTAWIDGHPTSEGAYWVQHEDGGVYLVLVDRRDREGIEPPPSFVDAAGNVHADADGLMERWMERWTEIMWCEPVGKLAWNRMPIPYQIMRHVSIPRPEAA